MAQGAAGSGQRHAALQSARLRNAVPAQERDASLDHSVASEPSSQARKPSLSFAAQAARIDVLQSSVSKGCCYLFKRCIRGIWATPQTGDASSPKEFIRVTLRELFIYLIFLAVVCIVTFGMTDSSMYYLTRAMKELFLNTNEENDDDDEGTFHDITNIQQLWKYLKGPLLTGLYWEKWYNRQNLRQGGYIYYQNKLLGTPRLRQLKVKTDLCRMHKDFHFISSECYPAYSQGVEDKTAFGPNKSWVYHSAHELGSASHWGHLATYSGAGFVQELGLTKNKSLGIINDLFDNGWITRGTRVVFLDFSVYNANVNLFCVVRLVVELPVTGGAIPSFVFNTVKLIRYVSTWDYCILAFEITAVVFLFYYMAEEYLEIKELGLAYFTTSFWNYVDIGIIIITLVTVVFSIVRTVLVNRKLSALLVDLSKYSNFEYLAYWERCFSDVIAITVFFAWIKIFKYISFNKTMTQLSSTLGRCAKDLAGFAIMFFIIFLAFTQLGYLLFGTQLKDFSSFQNSFFTLFRVLLGDFDYGELQAANSVLGPLYFVAYIFFVFFILLNMFLAIINDTYSEVKSELAQAAPEYSVADYFKELFNKMLKKTYFSEVETHGGFKLGNKELRFQEWFHHMKTYGYTDEELRILFDKYNTNQDDILDIEEQKRLEEDIAAQRVGLDRKLDSALKADYSDSDDQQTVKKKKKTEPMVTQDEFTILTDRVDHLEVIVAKVIAKVDKIVEKLVEKDI